MTSTEAQDIFIKHANVPFDIAHIGEVTGRLKQTGRKASKADRLSLAGALAHAAFLAPDRTGQVYDAVSEAWLDKAIDTPKIATLGMQPEAAPTDLWDMFWAVVEDASAVKLDAAGITERTAALGGTMPPASVQRVAEMSYTFPGIVDATTDSLPLKIDLADLAAQPAGSLGAEFHTLIVDNKFDLEVLDRAEIGLAELPSPLDYLNTRILQAHDLWHITAGYETTALHEIALSAFQMAQFGHNYSAQFLSIVAAVSALSPASGYKYLMDTITTAWVHGRETPPMMLIQWEDVWHKSAAEIRTDFGISEYMRPHRADLIEKTAPLTAFIRMVANLFQIFKGSQQSIAKS